MLRVFLFSCFALEAAGSLPLERAPPGVISRLPGQIGDSADHLVSSVGHEFGSGLDTVAQGVGEVPRAIGKAVGSVPEALGHGVGNVGDVGLEEIKRLAAAIGDTWRGAGQSIVDILGSLRPGGSARRFKRAAEDLMGLDFDQLLGLLGSSLREFLRGTNQGLCEIIPILEGATSAENTSEIAPPRLSALLASFHNTLGRVKDTVCSEIDVHPHVNEAISQTRSA